MIRIAIAEDRALIREGMRRVLDDQPGFRVVVEVENGYRLLEALRTAACDVVVLDAVMPGPGFVDTIERIRKRASPPQVLVVSGRPEEHYGVRALKAGALGYLQKDAPVPQLVEAVRSVADGRRYMTPRLADVVVLGLQRGHTDGSHEGLSPREFEVLRLLGLGVPARDVARLLHISPKTIGTYRTRIYRKLGLKGMPQLVRYAVESGISTAEAPGRGAGAHG